MAIKMNLYAWSAAELIHTYVGLHFDDFYGSDLSELEYIENNLCDFKEWASAMGYEIEV